MVVVVRISDRDVDALARTAMSEVGHFGRHGPAILKGGVEAVVDTIINRVVHPSFPETIDAVVEAPFQFSAIGGPGGSDTWERLPPASAAVAAIVGQHVRDRARGKSCTVEGATHFLNPNFSSPSALREWGDHVVEHAVAVWGKGNDIHFHGYAPGVAPPPGYIFVHEGASCRFSGRGVAEGAGTGGGAEAIGGAGSMGEGTTTAAQAVSYRVRRVTPEEFEELQDILNDLAEEGWRLKQVVAGKKDHLLVLEGASLVDPEPEPDDAIGEAAIDGLTGALGAGGQAAVDALVGPTEDGNPFDTAAFTAMIEAMSLKFFKPKEFLVLGGQHFSGPCKGKNTLPPKALWENIQPTARVLDRLRDELGAAIDLTSVYRSPAYNGCIPGAASGSVHRQFRAADFKCRDGRGPVFWARRLKAMRDAGVFKGGIGVYQTFVHVDTRGSNANFGPLMGQVF